MPSAVPFPDARPPGYDWLPDEAVARLEAAVDDVTTAIAEIRAGARDAEHYEL